MKYLIAAPDTQYFLWQVLVQINNFIKNGLINNTVYVIGIKDKPSEILSKIIEADLGCEFHLYQDIRVSPKYPSSLRPNILKQYFNQFPELQNEVFFYCDPDLLFVKGIDFSGMLDDDIWYLSNTRSYISSRYIKSKSEQLFLDMCRIVNISPKKIVENDFNAGGAQYLLKNINSEFWEKVERDSEILYQHMIATSKIYSPVSPIQAWTADMWAVLWNGIFFNHDVKIHNELSFAWATDKINRLESCKLYHNAGAVVDDGRYFLKNKYKFSPFNEEISCSEDYCSAWYVDEIKDTKNKFPNLLF